LGSDRCEAGWSLSSHEESAEEVCGQYARTSMESPMVGRLCRTGAGRVATWRSDKGWRQIKSEACSEKAKSRVEVDDVDSCGVKAV